MSARLPTVGADTGNWGTLLNQFLLVEHNADGTHPSSIKITKASSAPSSPATNDLWYDNVNEILNRWNGSAWVSLSYLQTPSGGSNGQVLSKNSAITPSGLQWSPVSSVDTSSIPQPLGTATPGTGTNGASPSDHVHAMPSTSGLADVDTTGIADGSIFTWDATAGKFKLRPIPIWMQVNNGDVTIPRSEANQDSGSFGATPSSGTISLTYFRAQKTLTIGHIAFQTGGTGPSSSTLARIGLYSVNSSTGDLTLVASTTNHTSFAGTFAAQNIALSASYQIAAGLVYAVGILQVATTPASMLGAWTNNQFLGLRPRLCATKGSLADLPSTITDASLSDFQFTVFSALLP